MRNKEMVRDEKMELRGHLRAVKERSFSNGGRHWTDYNIICYCERCYDVDGQGHMWSKPILGRQRDEEDEK